jgi:hypothetical protein
VLQEAAGTTAIAVSAELEASAAAASAAVTRWCLGKKLGGGAAAGWTAAASRLGTLAKKPLRSPERQDELHSHSVGVGSDQKCL